MTDTQTAQAYEIQRRQTIGNFLNHMSNLGYGNATGVQFMELSGNADDGVYSIDDSTPDINHTPVSTKAPAPAPESDGKDEDLDLDINPSEEDAVEFDFPE